MKIEVTFPKKDIFADPSGGGDTPQANPEAFPVGSVFIAVNDTDPATLLGYGTWQSFGAGKTLIGLDAADPDFDTDLKEGGAKEVSANGSNSQPVFSGNPLEQHSHPAASAGTPAGSVGTIKKTYNIMEISPGREDPVLLPADDHEHDPPQFTGKALPAHAHPASTAGTPSGTVSAPVFTGSPTSVVQPYVVVRFWQRVA